ncbi:MAG: 4Fe-4S dicluster domain-containing protein [Desulfovibrionaceae bacterium]
MKILRANRMEQCIGCYSCSLACARLVHKTLSWNTSGIRISSAGGVSTGFEARICVACDPAPCVAVCPSQCLTQRPGGGVKVDRSICIRCGKCAQVCPVDAIYIAPEDGTPHVCIHCGRCVAFCPQDCLELAPPPGRDKSAADDEDTGDVTDAEEVNHA